MPLQCRVLCPGTGLRYDPVMAGEDKRDVTVLVLGGPGQSSRRFRFNRRALGLIVLVLLCAGLGLGYVLGSRSGHAARSAHAPAAAPTPSTPAQVAARARPTPPPSAAVAVERIDAGARAQTGAAPAAAAIEPSGAGAQAGEPLLFVRDGPQGEQVIEIQPFAADGSPRASDLAVLETELACGSGHSQSPDPALVRVLLAVQHDFAKPLVLIGGRCPAHEDHAETAAHHRAGRAVDMRVRGVSSEQLMSWLVEHGVGGAGRYKRAGYVHVDVRTGPREQWQAQEPVPERAKLQQEPPSQAAASSQGEEAPAPAAAPDNAAPAPALDRPGESP
jgi:hypothetical protein